MNFEAEETEFEAQIEGAVDGPVESGDERDVRVEGPANGPADALEPADLPVEGESAAAVEGEEVPDQAADSAESEITAETEADGDEVPEQAAEGSENEVAPDSATVPDEAPTSRAAEIEPANDMAALLDAHDYDSPSVGDIRTGIIVSISNQGIIVDLGLKRDGLVQPGDIEQLSEEEQQSFKLNDEVPVYIVETGHSDRLIVSIQKARLNQDWIHAEEMLESGEVFEAPVIGQNRGGVIVPFGNLRGFVPASHLVEIRRGMDERQRQQVMARIKDQSIPLKVIEVNRRRRRLVLSQREAQKEWQESRKEELIESLRVGERRTGRVSGLRDFGAFVDLGGADGLIHISELAWHRVNHPREVLRIGQEIEVYVLDLDKEEQRIALSRKRLLPSPWSLAGEKYAINQLVEGRISRIVDYGAFVEVEPGIEGLLHVSQLSRETVQDPHQVVQEGETHLLRVISLDTEKQRIGLSLKSVSANEQIQWMALREAEAEAERAEAEAAAAAEAEARAAERAAASEEEPVDEAAEAVPAEDGIRAPEVTEEAAPVQEPEPDVEGVAEPVETAAEEAETEAAAPADEMAPAEEAEAPTDLEAGTAEVEEELALVEEPAAEAEPAAVEAELITDEFETAASAALDEEE